MNEFYTNPYYNADYTSPVSGFIPDQNAQQYPYYGPYAPQYQTPEQVYDDTDTGEDVRLAAQQQLASYIQQKREQERRQALNDYYTISAGDTLSKIAAAHGMTYQELARLNGIKNANMIRAGQRLRFNDRIDNKYENTRSYTTQSGVKRMQYTRKKNTSNNIPNEKSSSVRNVLQNTNDAVATVKYSDENNQSKNRQNNRVSKQQNDTIKFSSQYFPYKYIEYKPTKLSTSSSKKRYIGQSSNKHHMPLIHPVKNTRDVAANIGRRIGNQNADRRYVMYIYDIQSGRIPKNTSFGNYLKGLY